MKMRPLNRRTFLRGSGGIAIALPFLTAMEGVAQTVTPARRFVSVYTAHGFHRDTMNLVGTETNFTLSSALSSLAPYKSKLLVLDNVDLEVGYHAPARAPHFSMAMLLNGMEIQAGTQFTAGTDNGPISAGWGNGITLDQVMARTIGRTYPLSSLELGVQCGAANVWSRLSYTGPSQPVAPDESPASAFTRVFGNFTPPTTTPTPVDPLTLQKRSIIDRVKSDFSTLNSKLGPEDRQRMDAHLTAVRDIERRLSLSNPPPSSSSCAKPSAPPFFNYKDPAQFPAVGKLQMDILAMALICNITPVAQLLWSHCQNQLVMSWIENGIIQEGHHLISHSGLTNTAGQANLSRIDKWYADQFAYLLGKLDQAPEGGGTVLDNCALLWVTELSKGNQHDNRDMSFLLAGGCGGALKTGRFLRFGTPAWTNDILVALLNAMKATDAAGAPFKTFGNPAYCKYQGGHPQLLA
jgi:hypothetical protein